MRMSGAGKTVTVFLARIINRAPMETIQDNLLQYPVKQPGNRKGRCQHQTCQHGNRSRYDDRSGMDGGNMYDTLHPTETG